MNPSEPVMLRIARWCALGSAASVLFSIAVSQILLALAVAALLMSGARLRWPPMWLPLALFVAGTLISLALSDDPAAGIPQVRKCFVLLELMVVFSTFDLSTVRRLYWCWLGIGAAAGALACMQFAHKMDQARAAGLPFYDFYMSERISGFMSHWNTFSAHMAFVLLLALSFLLFATGVRGRARWLTVTGAAVVGVAMVLGFTRSIVWLACPGGGLYLVWRWRRWMAVLVPLVLLAGMAAAPASVKERFTSMFRPRKDIDSNEFRKVTLRTGWEMIKAHPVFGLGPERPKALFEKYVPPDIPRPLPTGWYGHLHSIYIHYAAERGIPTMLALMWMLAKILLDFLRQARKLPPGRDDSKFVLHAAVAVVIAVLLEGLFELNLGDSEVLAMFLAIVACGYVAMEAPAAEARQEERAVA
jgi:putative inorganic carbon (hco3(-)) transporter